MAGQLIEDMTVAWKPENPTDQLAVAVQVLVNDRIEPGPTLKVLAVEGNDDVPTPRKLSI